ncbi:MAG: hypothetical protein ABSH11_01015 [Verrucomicrobiota bacterium]
MPRPAPAKVIPAATVAAAIVAAGAATAIEIYGSTRVPRVVSGVAPETYS